MRRFLSNRLDAPVKLLAGLSQLERTPRTDYRHGAKENE